VSFLVFPAKDDVEVCVGDVITRGKNSTKTLRYLQVNNIKSALGNHEDKIVRYLQHQENIKKNPIVLDEDEQDIVLNLMPINHKALIAIIYIRPKN
jgi:bis(5'-nucleosyl)-tetraphosphatase (symmetrical)